MNLEYDAAVIELLLEAIVVLPDEILWNVINRAGSHRSCGESFIGTLKREMLQGGRFVDATDAELELFEYIDGYYNNQRKHSAIGYLTLNQFEAQQSNLN